MRARARVMMVALVVGMAFPQAGPLESAHADSTTTCQPDSWGGVQCTTTSSETSPSSGVGKRGVGSLAALTVLAALVASVVAEDSNATTPEEVAHNHEIALGIMVGVELLPNPLIVFFDDDLLEPTFRQQWRHTHTLIAEAWISAVRDSSKEMAPAPGGRITFGKGRVGLDASGESATDTRRYSLISGHLLLRSAPRSHSTIAVALGASRITLGDQVRTGLDVAVPHSYILSHDDATGEADVLISSRPGFFYGDHGLDVRIDAILVVPVASHVAVEIGGGVFSFDSQLSFKGSAGLALAL